MDPAERPHIPSPAEEAALRGEVAGALRRATIVPSGREWSISRIHVLQLLGTVLMGVGVVAGLTGPLAVLGVAGAVLMAAALRLQEPAPAPEIEAHFDPISGVAFASALPVVLRDEYTMATLTGRVGVLILDVRGAEALVDEGRVDAADAVMAAIFHRIEAHTWAYPIGGSFGPLLFRDGPTSIVIVRRDVLGDQSNEWLTERLVHELNRNVSWAASTLAPDVVVGAASGHVADVTSMPGLAALARREARQGPGGTVVSRQLDRVRRTFAAGAEISTLSDGAAVGLLFEAPDPGARVGIFEHLAGVTQSLGRAAAAQAGGTALIGASVTALSHPNAATELVARARAAGLEGRIGIVLPSGFPIDAAHRAARTVRMLHDAGFVIVADRRAAEGRGRPLPACPLDVVLVCAGFSGADSAEAADRALAAEIERRSLRAAATRPPVVRATPPAPHATTPGPNGSLRTSRDGSPVPSPLNGVGQQAHLAQASDPAVR